MLEFLKTIDWKSISGPTFFFLLSFFLVAAVVPNLHRLPELTKKLFDWLYSKEGTVKNAYAAGLLQRLSVIIRDIVLQMENTAIEDLKAKAADGKLTKEELFEALKDVKNNVIDLAVNHIKIQGLFEVVTKVLFSNEEDLRKWISDHIETQVATLPPSGLQTDGPALAVLTKAVVAPPPAANATATTPIVTAATTTSTLPATDVPKAPETPPKAAG